MPLLERYSDLALIGRFLFLKPVRHILCSVCLDRRSSPNIFAVSTSANIAFGTFADWPLGYGEDLYLHKRLWDIRDEESIALLRDRIEQNVLPAFRQIQSLDDFLIYTQSYSDRWHYQYTSTRIAVAKGDFDDAISIMESAFADGRLTEKPDYHDVLLTRDKLALTEFLHQSEASTIKQLKLEKYWQPTPFPLELQD